MFFERLYTFSFSTLQRLKMYYLSSTSLSESINEHPPTPLKDRNLRSQEINFKEHTEFKQ